MIKILHISTHKFGGAGNAAYRLHLALNEAEVVSSRFLYRNQITSINPNEKSIPQGRHLLHHRIANKLGIPILAWHKNRKIIDALKGNYEKISFPDNDFRIENHPWVKEADIIHLHWIADFINFKTFFKALKDKPMVWTFHDMYAFKGLFHYEEDEQRNHLYFQNIDNQIKAIKHQAIKEIKLLEIICPSNWLAQITNNSNIFSQKNIQVIPYSLPKYWFDLQDKQKAREKFGLELNLCTFLFVALDIDIERKGLKLIIEALKGLPKDKFQLLIVGNRNYDFGEHQVVKTGYLADDEDMRAAYAAADAYLLPSREDNLPNVMLEAFAQGVPVISFRNGGMADWIVDGFNGYLCEQIDSASLAAQIKKFLTNQDDFDRSKINTFAIENFSSTKQSFAYEKIYQNMLNINEID
jgi:glycosyltransferase involved in cell wall biosynthesis